MFYSFPVPFIEHTLPDPYITSLFNEQPDDNVQPTRSLMATVRWNEPDDAELILELADETALMCLNQKVRLTDDQLADTLLNFPLPHPAERAYEDILRSSVIHRLAIFSYISGWPFLIGSYQSYYHSKINTTGAFSTLHILPGNARW